jgi:transposase
MGLSVTQPLRNSVTPSLGNYLTRSALRLGNYVTADTRVRQSGGRPASHGRITKAGRAHARGMLVEAAWAAAKTPGPLRAFYQRVRARRGMQIAVVATARKLTTLCWQLVVTDQDYAFARPSLTAKKRRSLELRAGLPPRRGHKGSAAAYSLKEIRRRENEITEQAEIAYRQMVANWQPKPPQQRRERSDPRRVAYGGAQGDVAAANGARPSRP